MCNWVQVAAASLDKRDMQCMQFFFFLVSVFIVDFLCSTSSRSGYNFLFSFAAAAARLCAKIASLPPLGQCYMNCAIAREKRTPLSIPNYNCSPKIVLDERTCTFHKNVPIFCWCCCCRRRLSIYTRGWKLISASTRRLIVGWCNSCNFFFLCEFRAFLQFLLFNFGNTQKHGTTTTKSNGFVASQNWQLLRTDVELGAAVSFGFFRAMKG